MAISSRLLSPSDQLAFKGLLNSNGLENISITGKPTRKFIDTFEETCIAYGVTCVDDIPDVEAHSVNLRGIYLENKWYIVGQDINQFTQRDLEEAKRLNIKWIIAHFPEITLGEIKGSVLK